MRDSIHGGADFTLDDQRQDWPGEGTTFKSADELEVQGELLQNIKRIFIRIEQVQTLKRKEKAINKIVDQDRVNNADRSLENYYWPPKDISPEFLGKDNVTCLSLIHI